VPADRALLERVLASTGVERTPVPPESSYPGELGRAVREALLQAIMRGAEMLHLPRQAMIAAAFLAAAVAFFLIARALLPRLRRRRPQASVGELAAVTAPAAAPFADTAAGWRAELERHLAAGKTAAALEAVWWWLARSLAGSQAEPDWTSRDLVARTQRSDLAGLIRRLDAFIYGPLRPLPEDVRGLVARLEEALP
jgi:NAD(P)-dependent dehydrogenase (short-subunit alcohol dehydrogenase family)